jgi:hypothetical protein
LTSNDSENREERKGFREQRRKERIPRAKKRKGTERLRSPRLEE